LYSELVALNSPNLPHCTPTNLTKYIFYREYKEFLRKYMLVQMEAYEAGAGWFFWTAKTEDQSAPEWDYLFLLENGIAPKNMCKRTKICQQQHSNKIK
jgi:glucan 1,3-beta-glucosidase